MWYRANCTGHHNSNQYRQVFLSVPRKQTKAWKCSMITRANRQSLDIRSRYSFRGKKIVDMVLRVKCYVGARKWASMQSSRAGSRLSVYQHIKAERGLKRLKTKLIESGTTQTEVAEKVGVSLAYVNRITKGREQIVNKTFVKMMDELGYDVELTYKKKAAE